MAEAFDKATLRRDLLARRRALPEAERVALSQTLCAHLSSWLAARRPAQVFLFWPVKAEPDLLALPTLFPGTTYGLPVVDEGSGMVFHAWRPGDALVPNRYRIPEPVPQASPVLAPAAGTVVLTPCLALDRGGVRLGYGGGFYDRYLAAAPGVTTVGVLFTLGEIASLPAEGHDAVMAWKATEAGVRPIAGAKPV